MFVLPFTKLYRSRAHDSIVYVQLILPYIDLEIKYYDLGIENRDAVRINPFSRRY